MGAQKKVRKSSYIDNKFVCYPFRCYGHAVSNDRRRGFGWIWILLFQILCGGKKPDPDYFTIFISDRIQKQNVYNFVFFKLMCC